MDPLTHTLAGANLAAAGLRHKTRFATLALVAGANLPDVDSILYFTGHSDLALGCRRGWTHGILAIALLPFLQTGLLLVWDRLRPDGERRASAGWLLVLSFLAILTHPTLDWLNNYGLRWLMPFNGRWFYGDSVFIMDPWLWLILGCGWLAGRPPTRTMLVVWAFFSFAIAWVVSQRSASYLGVVALVALLLFVALVWRPRDRERQPLRFAVAALLLGTLYIGVRLGIHAMTVADVRRELTRRGEVPVRALMASPHPIDPRRWDVVAQVGEAYRFGQYTWGEGGLELADERLPVAKESPEWNAARRDPAIRGFITWVRFPWYEVERSAEGTKVYIHDARYATRKGQTGFGGVVVLLPGAGPSARSATR